MLTSTSGTMTASSTALAQPSDYLEDKYFTLTGTAQARITRKPMQEVIASYAYDGTGGRATAPPSRFFNDKTNLILDAMTDQAYPYTLYYYQQPAALSTATTTNFLTSTYPRLFRCALMAGASEFMKDAGMGNYDRSYWLNEAEKEIQVAQFESDRSEHTMEAGPILV